MDRLLRRLTVTTASAVGRYSGALKERDGVEGGGGRWTGSIKAPHECNPAWSGIIALTLPVEKDGCSGHIPESITPMTIPFPGFFAGRTGHTTLGRFRKVGE